MTRPETPERGRGGPARPGSLEPGPAKPEPAPQPAATLDWPALMRAGLSPLHQGGLALRPPEFWSLTPSELALMLGQVAGPVAAMGRARFEALSARYPDAPPQEGQP